MVVMGIVVMAILLGVYAVYAVYAVPVIPFQRTAFCTNTIMGCGFCKGYESVTAWMFGVGVSKTSLCALP